MRSTIPRVLLLAPILTLMLGCDSKSSSSTQSTEPTTNSQAQEAILTPEQRAHQKTLEEIEQLTAPYIALNNQLLDRGGIDPATLASIEDIDTRISMINQLNDYNTYILERYPILFNTLQGADTPQAV
ncbi:MAG: hypothetical protein JJ974_09310 [Phycisphaerales bacterium]|nr:hypothetical protein [Phycisphaerales bacterium]